MLLSPFLGPAMPGALFCVAAALIEYFFGLGPALTVMLVGLVIADYLFVPPYADFSVFDHSDLMLVVSYPWGDAFHHLPDRAPAPGTVSRGDVCVSV
jgi:hypothetical protein